MTSAGVVNKYSLQRGARSWLTSQSQSCSMDCGRVVFGAGMGSILSWGSWGRLLVAEMILGRI